MNINTEFTNDNNDDPNPEEVMEASMEFLFEKIIQPMKGELSGEDVAMLGIIGMSFKIIAQQARTYEDSISGLVSDNEEDFYRN